jgi:hypothetical protein
MMTEDEGATAEGQCSAPPGWFLPDDGSSSDMQECPSGTYKEVRRARPPAAAVAAAVTRLMSSTALVCIVLHALS